MDSNTLLENFQQYIQSLDPKIFGLDIITNVSLYPITSGHQNVNLVITLNNHPSHKYILRYIPFDHFDEYERTDEEYKKLVELDGFYAPKVFFLCKPDFINRDVLIMEFVEGVHKEFKDLTSEEIKILAKATAAINNRVKDKYSESPGAPPKSNGTYMDYLQAMKKNTITTRLETANPKTYEKDKGVISVALEKLNSLIERNYSSFGGTQFSMLHLDITPPNVLWHEGKITFIDWMALSWGDRAEDIAYIFAMNDLDENFQRQFLRYYKEQVNDPTLEERIKVYFLKLRIFDFAWSITKLDEEAAGKHGVMTKEEGLYKSFYDVRLKALKECLG